MGLARKIARWFKFPFFKKKLNYAAERHGIDCYGTNDDCCSEEQPCNLGQVRQFFKSSLWNQKKLWETFFWTSIFVSLIKTGRLRRRRGVRAGPAVREQELPLQVQTDDIRSKVWEIQLCRLFCSDFGSGRGKRRTRLEIRESRKALGFEASDDCCEEREFKKNSFFKKNGKWRYVGLLFSPRRLLLRLQLLLLLRPAVRVARGGLRQPLWLRLPPRLRVKQLQRGK